jgi:hypothetical protein
MRLALILALLLQLHVASTPAQTDSELPEASLSKLKGADLDLLFDVRKIGDRVAKLRGQSFRQPPLAVRVPESMRGVATEIRAYSVLPPERLSARGRAWEDVGLGDAGMAERVLLALAGDLRGIGFDPAGNRLLVGTQLLSVEDFEPGGNEDDAATVLLMTGVRPDEPLVSHLLMHVRQRERSGTDCLRSTTDEMLAGMAWAEGEANLVAVRYLFQGVGLSEDIFEHRVDPGGFLDGVLLPADLQDRPPIERDLLEFVYLDGFDFAVAEFRDHGWEALDGAMVERKSTRQMLHPGRSAPVTAFPEPQPPLPEGFRLVDEDVLGEKAIVFLIAHGTGKDNLGMIAGDGWAGGRLYRWEMDSGDGRGITDWVTRWDSPEAAKDFSYSFARALATRFPRSTPTEPGPGHLRLEAGDRVFLVQTGETEVRVLVTHRDWADSR